METYFIHIRLDRTNHRDVYVQARSLEEAIEIARRDANALERRWASFIG